MINFAINYMYFMTYSFFGWFCESAYCSWLEKKWVNRGFLNGPVTPIYGIGAIILIYFLTPLYNFPSVVFIVSMIVTTSLEYLCAVILETAFGMRWWDYTENKFNYKGRVCLTNSLLFGLMSVMLVYVIHPFIRLIYNFSTTLTFVIAGILLLYLVVDFTVSLITVLKLSGKLKRLSEILQELNAKSEEFRLSLAMEIDIRNGELSEKLRQHVEILKEKYNTEQLKGKFLEKRILTAFPKLQSKKYPELLSELKSRLKKK